MARRYRLTANANDTGIGRIEQGLMLLGFRVQDLQTHENEGGEIVYNVTFQAGKIGATGRRMHSHSTIEEVTDAEEG
jgi:hypothetical protein